MKEFYCIANSRQARALIENLQPLIGATIGIAFDLTRSLKDVFDRHPAVVFIQNEIEGIPGEKLAKKIRAMLDDEPMKFVLLYEDADSIHGKEDYFDASYNISHPDDELYRLILEFLHTIPDNSLDDDEKALRIGNGPAETVTEPPPPPEDKEKDPFDEFFDSDAIAFNGKPLPADDQVLQINMKAEEFLLESFPPLNEEEIVSFPDVIAPELPGNCEKTFLWDEGDTHINREVSEVTLDMSTWDADEGMASVAAGESSAAGEHPVPSTDAEAADTIQKNDFPLANESQETFDNVNPFSFADHHIKQPAKELSVTTPDAGASALLLDTPSPPPGGAVATAGRHEMDFRRVEKESPHQLFGSMMDEANNSPFRATATGKSKMHHKGKPSLGALNHRASFSREACDHSAPDNDSTSGFREKQVPGTRKNGRKTGQTVLSDGPRDTALLTNTMTTPHKGFIISLIVVLTLATLFVIRQWYYDLGIPGLSVSQESPAVKPMASPPPAQTVLPVQELPKFIPRVAPDSLFALAHPGWERYEADSLEYNIYRESGRIKAIQVMAGINGVITVPFFKSCVRETAGNEEYSMQGAETRNDFKIIRGTLLNKGEVAIYQKMPEGAIRGFVLTMP
jgi:hypothetical protein